MPKTIRIKYQNGINRKIAEQDILNIVQQYYIFEESDNADFILFGPYGNDLPPPGNYIRIGYFCENIKPDLSICEWAFGVPTEAEVDNPKYKRIQWHGLNPELLIKHDFNPEDILRRKNRFCNFLYSHRVTYREDFCKQLSNYSKVDAPGLSMNNMPSIDGLFNGDLWQRKRQFLGQYKFTIAFENYVYPGYQTEKLYDAMQMNSIPIYCGDPNISDVFNTKSFINVADYIKHDDAIVRWLEKYSQSDFVDIRPHYYHNLLHRIKRKLKEVGKNMKMKLQFSNFDFSPVIERIMELNQDGDKYIAMLREPWFNGNKPPETASMQARWIEIFNSK